MAAVLEQAEHQSGDHMAAKPSNRISRFGSTTDAVEAGRRGGKATAAQRRFREVRKIEEQILASSNGAAKAAVLRLRLERQAELERERLGLDQVVRHLTERAAILEQQIADGHERLRVLDDQAEQRRQQASSLESDDVLDALLLELGEARIEAACERVGWYDSDGDER